MKRFYTFLASLLLIVACSDTNLSTYTESDALEFLERIEKEDEEVKKIYDGLSKYDVPLIYKLGIWAKESAAGRPYSSLGFELVDDVAETNVEIEQPVDDFKPKF